MGGPDGVGVYSTAVLAASVMLVLAILPKTAPEAKPESLG